MLGIFRKSQRILAADRTPVHLSDKPSTDCYVFVPDDILLSSTWRGRHLGMFVYTIVTTVGRFVVMSITKKLKFPIIGYFILQERTIVSNSGLEGRRLCVSVGNQTYICGG